MDSGKSQFNRQCSCGCKKRCSNDQHDRKGPKINTYFKSSVGVSALLAFESFSKRFTSSKHILLHTRRKIYLHLQNCVISPICLCRYLVTSAELIVFPTRFKIDSITTGKNTIYITRIRGDIKSLKTSVCDRRHQFIFTVSQSVCLY